MRAELAVSAEFKRLTDGLVVEYRKETSDLRKSIEEWVTHYNEVEAWRAQLSASNAALREQLAQMESERQELWFYLTRQPASQLSHAQMMTIHADMAAERDELRSQLAQVTSERDEAKQLLREVSNVHLGVDHDQLTTNE